MNAVAPTTFYFLQWAMIDAMIMRISRLSDPPYIAERQAGRIVSVRWLIDRAKLPRSSERRKSLSKCFRENKGHLYAIRRYRNKRVAHDEGAGIIDEAKVGFTLEDLDGSVVAIQEAMSLIKGEADNSEVAYEHTSFRSDSHLLFKALELGRDWKKTRNQRAHRG